MPSRWIRPGAGMRRPWLLALLPLALLPLPAWAVDEVALKAAVAYKLMMFAEWPSDSLAADGPLVLCAGSGSPYGEALQSLRGQTVGRHRMEVREVQAATGLHSCHALLLDGTGRSLGLARPGSDNSPLLVVADELPGIEGVVVQLALRDGRITFDVYLGQARRRGLKLSSQLLRLARTVHE